jgi:F-type H+-transporting ATPase subunit b
MARNYRELVLAGVAVLALAPAALAAPGEEPHPIPTLSQGLMTSISAVVVFSICSAVLLTVVWPKILKGLKDREGKILESIEAAEAAQQQAKIQLEQYNQALASARAEAQRMLEAAKVQQQKEAAEMRERAQAEAQALVEKAKRDIDAARKQALQEIYTQGATLATTVAAKVLQREVQGGDTQRMVDDALTTLAGSRN